MTTIRRIALLVSIAASFLSEVTAQTSARNFSVSAQTGILHGRAEELVYKFPGNDSYLSELLWDIKPLFYAGIAAETGPRDPVKERGFTAAFSLKFGFPFAAGIMEDRDWYNDTADYMTHYSRHDAYFQKAVLTDLSAGYSWNLAGFLSLKAYGEFSYMYFSWGARGGYIQYPPEDSSENYPPWDDSFGKIYLSGKVITYAQNWFILSPGLSLTAKLNRLFSVEGSFGYTPLIYCSDRDEHLKRGLTYLDYLYFGNCLKGSGRVTFSPAENLELSLSVLYRYISGPRGDTHVNSIVYTQGAGAGYSAFDAGLTAKFYIGRRKD